MSTARGTPEELRITLSFDDTGAVFDLDGELDSGSALELSALFDAMFDRGHDAVVLDVAKLGYMDATSVRVVAYEARRLRAIGGVLTLRSPSSNVRRVFENNGLADVIEFDLGATGDDRLGPEQQATDSHVLRDRSRDDLAYRVGHVMVIPADGDVIDGALRLVVNLATATVGGADGASVSLYRDGRVMTVAASDHTVSDMDAGQYAAGEGPCLDATLQGRWFHVESLHEETRWPTFIPVARALGIRAILSNPLIARNRPVGALNIYSRAVAAFGLADQALASQFATEASAVLSHGGLGVSEGALAQRLKEALRVREVIAQAQGVLMEREHVDEDAAFDKLRRISQHTDRPLRDHAMDIVMSTSTNAPSPDQIAGGLDD